MNVKSVKAHSKPLMTARSGSLMPEDDQNLETVMGLIMNGGNAKKFSL